MPNSRGGWLQEPGWEKFTLWAETGKAPPLHLGNIVTLSAGLLDDPVLLPKPPQAASHWPRVSKLFLLPRHPPYENWTHRPPRLVHLVSSS